MPETLLNILAIAGLILGFGFVVFWHELGHFLAARYVGVRVEQFAVGMGHAVLSWRRGIGFRMGNTRAEYEARTAKRLEEKGIEPTGPDKTYTEYQRGEAAKEMGLGETEYRLSWLPIGGYVKPTGQDDLRPAGEVDKDDPYSYAAKSVGARMLIISAGVIMNVILAAILFALLFWIGFNTQPSMVGGMPTGSPAQKAGIQVGDYIRVVDGRKQHSIDKLGMNIALARPGQRLPTVIERDGKLIELPDGIRPESSTAGGMDLLSIGLVSQHAMFELRGLDPRTTTLVGDKLNPAEQVMPGEEVIAISDYKVPDPRDIRAYIEFDRRLQNSKGQPIELTVRKPDGSTRTVRATPQFAGFFGDTPFNLAGLQPRPQIVGFQPDAPVAEKLKLDDVIVGIEINGEARTNLAQDEFVKQIREAARAGKKVDFIIEREGKTFRQDGVVPTVKTDKKNKGIGVSLDFNEETPVIGGVMENSPAAQARIPRGARILKINGQDVRNWFDVHTLLKAAGDQTIAITLEERDAATGKTLRTSEARMSLSKAEQAKVEAVRFTHKLQLLQPRIEPRVTHNPLEAVAWGLGETRDMLVQFYVMLHRLITGDVSPSHLLGPVGIVRTGSILARRGPDWLIWFLAMISANLAVVNFLPIPIVDGGHFVFLLYEKITGRQPPPRVQVAAQIVGLAMILFIFLFVTYNDITRW